MPLTASFNDSSIDFDIIPEFISEAELRKKALIHGIKDLQKKLKSKKTPIVGQNYQRHLAVLQFLQKQIKQPALSSVHKSTIALFFKKCIRTMEAYRDGCMFGTQEFTERVYKSHRRMDRALARDKVDMP